MRLYFILILSVIALATPAMASNSPLLEKAAQEYYAGRLDQAQSLLSQIKGNENTQAQIEYNLGNIAYKKGHLGAAIAHYKRASKIVPRDADLRANLHFVLQKRIDDFRFENLPTVIGKQFFFWNSFISFTEALKCLSILWAIIWIMGWLYLVSRKALLRMSALGLLPFLLIFAASVAFKYDLEYIQKHAVISIAEASVTESFLNPDKSFVKLHEGSQVQILSEQKLQSGEIWLQIQLMENKKGWIKKDNVEII